MLRARDAKLQLGPAQLQGGQLSLSPASTGLHLCSQLGHKGKVLNVHFLGSIPPVLSHTGWQMYFLDPKSSATAKGIIWFPQGVHQRLSNALI